ncbi:endonuclease G [Pseudarcicella hirudinis]|uniref:Endonuclease n=1 Tax=Pseudarcicella hirudinis TaxID=1079859 RepID=A0A1I5Y664_9BACT|nr:DNA/RNA non-specific endonuclease [Pseudarcicella hirudinis]SFQ39679.1 endonuclease G [Pseudarcicella hirudinis]
MSKIKFLIFLIFLGIFLYYLGKSNPLNSFKKDVSKIFNHKKSNNAEPWTRAGRGDTIAVDDKTRTEESVATDEKGNKEESSLFDIFKSKDKDEPGEVASDDNSLEQFIPVSSTNKEIVRHKAYILNYCEEYEQASWVLHKLVKEAAFGRELRSNEFMPDPLVESGSAIPQDYSRSGYDRGHLCPAGDFRHDKVLQDETFYMSNMSPQVPDFNRGIWSDIENKIRSWVKRRQNLIVVTGPVLKQGLPSIGRRNQVAVPEQYYKIVYDPAKEQAIAFLIANQPSFELIKSFTVSIDEIEKLTKIDFFAKLPDSLEKKIETQNNTDDWF